MSPERRRRAVCTLQERFEVSERNGCRIVWASPVPCSVTCRRCALTRTRSRRPLLRWLPSMTEFSSSATAAEVAAFFDEVWMLDKRPRMTAIFPASND